MHEKYVEPSKKYADLIICGGMNPVALDVVESKVRAFLHALN
jgi:uridine kinase